MVKLLEKMQIRYNTDNDKLRDSLYILALLSPLVCHHLYEVKQLLNLTLNLCKITGAAVNIRMKPNKNKLAVWMTNASNPDSVVRIGKMLKVKLGLKSPSSLRFNIHKDEKVNNNPKRSGPYFKKSFFL